MQIFYDIPTAVVIIDHVIHDYSFKTVSLVKLSIYLYIMLSGVFHLKSSYILELFHTFTTHCVCASFIYEVV